MVQFFVLLFLLKGSANPLNFAELIERVQSSVVSIRTVSSLQGENVPEFGSGLIVAPEGLILTSAHLVDRAEEIFIHLYDGRQEPARVIGSDEKSDLALLKIEAKDLPAVTFAHDEALKVGQWVIAIGSPFGFERTATAGIISAKNRLLPDNPFVTYLQTDAAINPGSSGSPLFNLRGEVVGVSTLIFSQGAGFSGVAFALPSRTVRFVLEQLRKKGKVAWGWIGIEAQDIDLRLSRALGLEKPQGIVVVRVSPGSPAEKAGLRVGDVILRYDNRFIKRVSDFLPAVAMMPIGHKISLLIWRWGALLQKSLTVAETPSEEAEESSPKAALQSFPPLGVVLEESEEGLVVRKVVSEKARRSGFLEGDLVVAVADRTVKTISELKRTLEQFVRQKRLIPILIERDEQARFLVVQR